MDALEITAGQTAPIRILLDRKAAAASPFLPPDLTGATPRLTIEDVDGHVLFAKDGTVVSPAGSSGTTDFAPTAGEIAAPADGAPPIMGYAQVRITYGDGSTEYYPKQGERFPCLIYRPLG